MDVSPRRPAKMATPVVSKSGKRIVPTTPQSVPAPQEKRDSDVFATPAPTKPKKHGTDANRSEAIASPSSSIVPETPGAEPSPSLSFQATPKTRPDGKSPASVSSGSVRMYNEPTPSSASQTPTFAKSSVEGASPSLSTKPPDTKITTSPPPSNRKRRSSDSMNSLLDSMFETTGDTGSVASSSARPDKKPALDSSSLQLMDDLVGELMEDTSSKASWQQAQPNVTPVQMSSMDTGNDEVGEQAVESSPAKISPVRRRKRRRPTEEESQSMPFDDEQAEDQEKVEEKSKAKRKKQSKASPDHDTSPEHPSKKSRMSSTRSPQSQIPSQGWTSKSGASQSIQDRVVNDDDDILGDGGTIEESVSLIVRYYAGSIFKEVTFTRRPYDQSLQSQHQDENSEGNVVNYKKFKKVLPRLNLS